MVLFVNYIQATRDNTSVLPVVQTGMMSVLVAPDDSGQ